ncbi:MAG: chemotaxis protein CheD, partial [Alicyclobacillus sp.]|nr:chemotaxis protein CheD [Alicyclobacillus sp.]
MALRGRLRTAGLGSCVGVVIFDTWARIAGLAHVMLPASPGPGSGSPAKYAATAVPWLVRQICQAGGSSDRLKAKLAGGAQMFASTGMSDFMRVGP